MLNLSLFFPTVGAISLTLLRHVRPVLAHKVTGRVHAACGSIVTGENGQKKGVSKYNKQTGT